MHKIVGLILSTPYARAVLQSLVIIFLFPSLPLHLIKNTQFNTFVLKKFKGTCLGTEFYSSNRRLTQHCTVDKGTNYGQDIISNSSPEFMKESASVSQFWFMTSVILLLRAQFLCPYLFQYEDLQKWSLTCMYSNRVATLTSELAFDT